MLLEIMWGGTFNFLTFTYCMTWIKTFRNIFYFRTSRNHPYITALFKIIFPEMNDIEISGDIGGGLVIWHGYGLVLACHKIGENCSIWQGVTIGRNPKPGMVIDKPTIGDNVSILTNAVVAGGIEIGDNTSIGAGSIVLKSMPSNVIVAGNPAKIIRKRSE